MSNQCDRIGHGPIDKANMEGCDEADCAACEIERLTAELDRIERWSTLDRADDTFAEFDLEQCRIRHELADTNKTCDFQTMHHDRKCLIERVDILSAESKSIKDATRQFWIWMYNKGYAQGHHDTMEGLYTDVLPVDMEAYHDDIVSDLLAEYAAEKGQTQL